MPLTKRTLDLIESLNATNGLTEAQTTMLRRERQYHDVTNRAQQIDQRCREIGELLPDASAKERTKLLEERRDLLAEAQALPSDRRVHARLFAEALAVWSPLVRAAIDVEHRKARQILDSTERQNRELRYQLAQGEAGTSAFDAVYQELNTLVEERAPQEQRIDDLKELREHIREFVDSSLPSTARQSRPGGVKMRDDGGIATPFLDAFIREVA